MAGVGDVDLASDRNGVLTRAQEGTAQGSSRERRPLARDALQRGDYAEAVALLEDLAARKPVNADVQVRLGHALLKVDRVADADAAFRKALALDPKNAKARLAVARISWDQGRRSEAVAHLEAAASHDPGNPTLQLRLGERLLGQLRVGEAIACFRRVLEAEPRNSAALKSLGQAFAYLGNTVEALAALREASEISPDDPQIQQQIVRVAGETSAEAWKIELGKAVAALNAPELKPGLKIAAARTLLYYGMTGALKTGLAPLEGTSAVARQLLQMARQLDRMGLASDAPDAVASGERESGQLNALTGITERFAPGCDTVALVFSGAGDRAFLSIDVIHRILRKTGVSLVYLRDLNRSLFLGGIVGVADDFAGTTAAFRSMKDRCGARRLVVIGHCAGAPAALRFGLALEAEAVLAISPRIVSREVLEERRARMLAEGKDVRSSLGAFAGDLSTLYAGAALPPRVTLLAGAGMEPECSFSRDMAARVPGVAYAEISGGRKDCLGVALTLGVLSPLFFSFIREGAVAPEIFWNAFVSR